jgi:phage-related minor tail protein
MTEIDGVTVRIDADTKVFRSEIVAAQRLARGFGASINAALSSAIVYGRDFDSVLSTLGLRLSSLALNTALKPLEEGLSGAFKNLFSGGSDDIASAARAPLPFKPMKDGAEAVQKFATGGVISAPTYFPMGVGLGLAGERGAEAIMPLARGADGKLGVAAQGQPAPLNITVNVSTPDAASFRRSESYLSGVIARAVARGERRL